MKRSLSLIVLSIAFVAGSWALTSCSHTPAIYTKPANEVDQIRSDIGTVGVVISSYRSQIEVVRPARGWWGGVKRGFVVGAAAPIVVGFVSPVPGGTLIGVLFAPFTAVAGSVYGAFKALPPEEIDKTEAALNEATARIRSMNLKESFVETVARLGNERTGWKFVHLRGKGPKTRAEVVSYDRLEIPGIDAVLEIRIERSGLRGLLTIDPPSSAFLELRSRLIRPTNNEVLYEQTLFCMSEKRTFAEWDDNEGELFIDAFVSCVPRLAEKVVDDFFLVYPITFD
ncbi:MAG: hypothetical protein JSU72_18945 [Deltaproteobacteria bacterium]|nr:MAG: hypothetical protein JSU72_18945 [Deltaproteobacteria bacterium]